MTTSSSDWVHIRSPFVYWAQTEKSVSLRVEIKNAQSPRIHFEDDKVVFDSTGRGAHGESEYHFELDLPHSIDAKACTYRVLDRDIDIQLKKREEGWWSKVIATNQKPAWLKVDFDRWRSPDDEDELPQDVMKDYPDMLNQLQQQEFGYKVESLRNVYLFLYNMFQFVGFLYIVGVLSVRWLREGSEVTNKAFELVGFAMCYCQILQLLEILHPMFGFTKTGVAMAVIQIGGRGMILFGMIVPEPRIQTSSAVFLLFLSWSLIEIIRYPFYMLQISNIKVYAVTWLRYSAWIVLYPIGIFAETAVIFGCIPYYVETGKYSISLPNKWNQTFHFPALMRLYLLFGTFPVLFAMMRNMWRLRCKNIKSKTPRIKKQ